MKLNRYSRLRRQGGQTLVEYGFVGALVLVVVMAVVLTFGNSLSKVMGGLKTDMKSHATDAAAAKAAYAKAKQQWIAAQAAARAGSGGPVSIKALMKGGVVCAGSICVKVPAVTAGSMGGGLKTAYGAAAALNQILNMLKADPNADPSLVSMITRLANMGHTLADMESLVYGCQNGGTCGGTLNKGVDGLKGGRGDFEALSQQVRSYLASHPGSLPGAMANVVNFESEQVMGIAYGYSLKGGTTWSWNGNASAATHNSSNNICRNGGSPPACVQ